MASIIETDCNPNYDSDEDEEEHRLWVNLNEFRKQFFTFTLPQDVADLLFSTTLYWADEDIVWKSDDEKKQAQILRRQRIRELKEEGKRTVQ